MRRIAIASALVLAASITGLGVGPAAAATHNVVILGALGPLSYQPGSNAPAVTAGDLITFTNASGGYHSATSTAAGVFDTGIIAPRKAATIDTTGMASGTYNYFCTLHPSMRASLTIS